MKIIKLYAKNTKIMNIIQFIERHMKTMTFFKIQSDNYEKQYNHIIPNDNKANH